MLNFDVKRKINTLRDILVGKVPDPKAQVEQITIAMIYKFMDDMDIEAMEFGGERVFFKDEYEEYAWSNLMSSENSGQQRAFIYAEGIDKMSMNPYIPQLFRDIFKNAYIPYRDPETLNMFLKEIGEFSYDNSEDLGNAFEYLLLIMGSQGDAGQFRTPRHIIDMMVEIVDPKKNDTILDPACGTAGFLISAYKHILKTNVDENGKSTLTSDDKKRLTDNFAGYDISPDMVRLARVNMYLHHFTKPQISEYDTLSNDEKWDDNYDVIFANPPFMTPKGGIIPHSRYRVKAKRAEVLFVDYISEHLNPTGKAAIIVPEGIVFQSANAYKELRKYLVDDGLLYAVISLPAGVFNPYSGVKTSVLLIDKPLARMRDDILFVKMNNDGFDLGAQRREIKQNDIPDIVNTVKAYQKGEDVRNNPLVTIASKEKVAEQDYILVGERYIASSVVNSQWDCYELGKICITTSGGTPKSTEQKYYQNGTINWLKSGEVGNGFIYDTEQKITQEGLDNSSAKVFPINTVLVAMYGATVGQVGLLKVESATNQAVCGILPNDRIIPEYLYYLLKGKRDYLISLSTGGAQPNISQTIIKKLCVPVPPLSVQQEIIEEIESYQKIIDGAKLIVDNYKPTIKINPNWQSVEIGNMYDISYGVTVSIPQNEDEKGIKIISTAEVGLDGQLDLTNIRKVHYETKYEKFILAPDTLLFNWRNAPKHVGKTAWFLQEDDKYISASFLLSLKNKNSECYDNGFVWCALNNLRDAGYFMRNARQAVNQANFNGDQLSKTKLFMPNIDEQKRIMQGLYEEMVIVEKNKRLLRIFEQKIKDKISEVWGE